ncbi:MAG: thioredoxin domain-containing protein [Alphaproteobacteria bacterium]|nr:thioredoxin domain-containing protein [Alphaproteobacteria bacterium]
MNFDRNTLIAGGVAAALVLGGIGYWVWGTGSSTPTQVAGDCVAKPVEVSESDYSIGKADAPVTIVEYASMTCPHCARFSRDVLPLVKQNFVDRGYVRYVFREFPIDRVALTASVVGRCLQKDAYIPFVEMMYSEIETWGRSEDPRAAIKEMARRAGMSGDDFEKCLSTDADAKKILATQETAMKDFCVGGTPSFFIDGKFFVAREVPYEEMDTKLREALKAKGVEVPAAAATAAPAEGAATTEGATAAPAEGATTAPAEGTTTPASGAASTPAEGAAKPAETPPAAATPSEPAKAPPAP